MDIEKQREEGNWRRCLELAQQNGAEQVQLQNFLTGEAKLELFLDELSTKKCQTKERGGGDEVDRAGLEDAKRCLKRCLEGDTDTPLTMDANLLLAKAYYISGDFRDALRYIQKSGIDTIVNIDRTLPLRVIKLIAESFSVKGMSLAKTSPRRKLKYIDHSFDLIDGYSPVAVTADNDEDQTDGDHNSSSNIKSPIVVADLESYRTQIECLTKAANLAMRYVQNMEKSKGPYFAVSLGHILDSAVMKTHHVYINTGRLGDAIDYCRRMLNYTETASTLNIRQILSKELAEILLKAVCRSTWRKPDLIGGGGGSGPGAPGFHGKSTPGPTAYIGNSLFTPHAYEEEVILLLMLSEALTSLNVVLERTPECADLRIHSLNNVLLIQDLYTIALIPLQCYYVDNFERSMKFSYEVKHMWFQFALTLMESRKAPQRTLQTLKEVMRMDGADPLPNLIAAKLCMTELSDAESAIRYLEDALRRFDEYSRTNDNHHHPHPHYPHQPQQQQQQHKSNLSPSNLHQSPSPSMIDNIGEIYGRRDLRHQIHLMLGIAHALRYECDTEASKKFRSKSLADSLRHLEESIRVDRFGNRHLPYYHIALHMAHQRAIPQAIRYVRVALMLNATHLPSIQLLILCLTAMRAHQEALELCGEALRDYPEHLILLYIKAHLEEICCESGRELALLTAKQMLKQWRHLNSDEIGRKLNHRTSYCTSFVPNVNYDTMSLRMEQTLSEVISLESAPFHIAPAAGGGGGAGDTASQNNSRYLSQTSSVNGCSGSLPAFSDGKNSWAFEMQIWLMIVELFLKLDQISEAEACVTDGTVTVFGLLSHQLMYIKGVISKKRAQWYDAKVHFQNAISINPKHARALQQLGHTYYLLGNHISADKYLKDSLNIDSTLHETWSYMGLVLDAIGEHERAYECHLTSLRLEETNPILPFSLISRTVFD